MFDADGEVGRWEWRVARWGVGSVINQKDPLTTHASILHEASLMEVVAKAIDLRIVQGCP